MESVVTSRWSVSVVAEGDRVLTCDEVVELADAVASYEGIASGVGSCRYGAQVVVIAGCRQDAVAAGAEIVRVAVARAGLPSDRFVCVEAISEEEDAVAAFGDPEIVDRDRG